MNELATALDLCGRMPVFPVLANKHPACPHGFKDAATDPDEVRHLWRRWPGPLIGCPTGERSGFDVLDLDPRHGAGAWWDRHAARVPETRIYETRSKGWHLLFRHQDGIRNSAGKLGPGVDVRGEGGYVILWHAAGFPTVSDADIADWPEWLIDAMTHRRVHQVGPAKTLIAETKLIQRVIENAIYRVETATPGNRHYQLRAAACTIGGVLDAARLSASDVVSVLVSAAMRAGAEDARNAEKTALWGIERGRETPLSFVRTDHG